MQNTNFNYRDRRVLTTEITKIFSVSSVCFLCALCGLTFLFSCGSKNGNTKAQKKIEITVTGLDGNGIAEKKITDDLMTMDGVKTISFNYLNNQVVVLFDTTKVSQSAIITKILQSNEGKHKVLDVKINTEPLRKETPVKPDPQEDIHDDTGDEHRNSG